MNNLWKGLAILGIWGSVAYAASIDSRTVIIAGICALIATFFIATAD